MKLLDRLRRKKVPAGKHSMREAIRKVFEDEGLPWDDELAGPTETEPTLRLFRCSDSCPPLVFVGDSHPPRCPKCDRVYREIEVPVEIQGEPRDRIASEGHFRHAVRRFRAGDAGGAAKALTRAIELRPDFADAYYNRGEARIALGDLAGAIEDCNRAIELEPGDAEAYLNRGAARAMSGDFESAVADTTRALELGSKRPIAYFNRGMSLLRLGRSAEGRADLEDFLRRAPDDSRAAGVRQILGSS